MSRDLGSMVATALTTGACALSAVCLIVWMWSGDVQYTVSALVVLGLCAVVPVIRKVGKL